MLTQSFRDFELIVVDDGSIDESYNQARNVLQEVSIPHQLIHQKNLGVSTARNNGVTVSRGDYLCFLDADDWWAPEFLERMEWLIREYPEAGIYGTNYYYVKNGKQSICVTTAETGYINYCRVYAKKLQMPLWTGAVCLSRDMFKETGGFRSHLKLGEDFDLWIRIALKSKVAFLNEPLSYYFQDSDAIWRGVGHLINPRFHMLWNMEYLADQEHDNPDFKKLIDNLRTYSLLPYYLSRQYHEAAKNELSKVEWKEQPIKVRILYRTPIAVLKVRRAVLRAGSTIKQWLIKYL